MTQSDALNSDALRLQLQQAMETIRSTSSLIIQSLGFFITADTLLVAYGLSQRKAGIVLMAALTVVGMFVTLWRGIDNITPAVFVAIHLERLLLPNQITLIDTFVRLKLPKVYEPLSRTLALKDEQRQEGYRRISMNLLLKSRTLAAFVIMFLLQIGLFVVALAVFHHPFL